MSKRRIAPVANNAEKQQSYSVQMQRFNKAMKNGFFFEAVLIDYAMIEDRLRSVLYHSAFFANRDAMNCWKKTRSYFQQFVMQYKKTNENEKLGVKNISGKIKIVRSILRWVNETEFDYQNDLYLKTLKNQCESLDIGGLLETLEDVEKWCGYRNEIVHALMNKNVNSVYLELEKQARLGMEFARFIDAQERLLKKGNIVRNSINAPKE